jgi:hypothetical protein
MRGVFNHEKDERNEKRKKREGEKVENTAPLIDANIR